MSIKTVFVIIITIVLSVSFSEDVSPIMSDSLKRTQITPFLESKIKPEQNLIYCATFQLAWNELRDSFTVHMTDDPEIIKKLDKKMFIKDYLSEDCYVAMSGTYRNIAEKINKLLKEKFEDPWLLTKERVLEDRFTEDTFMAYAYLFKNLVFWKMFEDLDEPILFSAPSEKVEVDGFGIKEFTPNEKKHKDLGKQVTVFYYNFDYEKMAREFIIGLKSTSLNEEIIIAQISPRKTLFETYKAVQEIIAKNEPDSLRKYETLQIPKFDFDIEHTFPEIERYLSSLVVGSAKAYQRVKFRLSEKGAILKSEAIILPKVSVQISRVFVVSEPFLIYLKQKDSQYPYLAIWVANEELLVKTD